ncbi:uncharacterized protein LOC135391955 isoform X2 [Ornithodoros turicata]|uniref:uncharacterized protein LOC135391955 isoform X2 n=1 Tax=Ornithodoros turicata TaxID=34597 RepID=UPI003138F791
MFITGAGRTVFTLDEAGDLTWKIPENAESMPFFNYESFEVFLGNPHYIRFFGTFAGHVIEFRVAHSDEDSINLIYEGWFLLQCERLSERESRRDEPFGYLRALEEGYFADLVITAANGKQFHVHRTLLKLGNAEVDWGGGGPLEGLPEPLVCVALHFLYGGCLPPSGSMDEAMARDCLATLGSVPGFGQLARLCNLHLRQAALKQQVVSLVTEVHTCAENVVDYFSGAKGATEGAATPAHLCFIAGRALRECAVGCSKLLLLCHLFSKQKSELSREERHEIIKYCVSRLPTFMNQLQRLLEAIKKTFGNYLGAERAVLAAYLVPEIESSLESLFQLVTEAKTALEILVSRSGSDISASSDREFGKRGADLDVSRSLRHSLHIREQMKMRGFCEKVAVTFGRLMRKKESFCEMGASSKVRSVSKKLEQFIGEIPVLLLRIEELRSAVVEKQSWKEWKFLFKLGTSKVTWVLNQIVAHREALQTTVVHLTDLIARDQFSAALAQLGILETGAPPDARDSNPFEASQMDVPAEADVSSQREPPMESLYRPLLARDSPLAHNSLHLLREGTDTDMMFEIVVRHTPSSAPFSPERESPPPESRQESTRLVAAHRAIVATRCEWFKKALLSGMRESIHRKIVVHDTTPEVFGLFLEYLYCGFLNTDELGAEQLSELMQLGDRYEVDRLKLITEDSLRDHIDEDSALYLLNLADQLNARHLRNSALEFIALNKDMAKSEVFHDLPEDLQSEVMEMVTWFELRSSQRPEETSYARYFEPDSPSSASSSLLDVDEFASVLTLSPSEENVPENVGGDEASPPDEALGRDAAQLELCVELLRDVVGAAVPRDDLVRVSLAADYDLNRALNFFFS